MHTHPRHVFHVSSDLVVGRLLSLEDAYDLYCEQGQNNILHNPGVSGCHFPLLKFSFKNCFDAMSAVAVQLMVSWSTFAMSAFCQ